MVVIRMLTPWRYNVYKANKLINAFTTLTQARRWTSQNHYDYIVKW